MLFCQNSAVNHCRHRIMCGSASHPSGFQAASVALGRQHRRACNALVNFGRSLACLQTTSRVPYGSNDSKTSTTLGRITFKAFQIPLLASQTSVQPGRSCGWRGGQSSRAVCSASSLVEPDTEQSVSLQEPQQPATARKKRVLSGVQPTGLLHLGNYLGAIRNWVALQELYDTFFCVVDMHAITLPHEPKDLREATRRSAALYIAAGIDPAKASIFVQSHVPAHAELTWLLMCYTPIGWLRRMIQFKEKSAKAGAEEVGAGLLTYPVLMAADILLYQADLVPVGEDQKQHIELARDIAERFNSKFGGNKWKKLGGRGGRIFKVPNIFIPPAGARVMSLTDGTSKMSKSAESDMSRINLLDTPDEIAQKIKRAKTDAFEGLELDNPDRPEARNLLTIYSLVTGQSMEVCLEEVGSMSWGQFKPLLADAVVAHLEPLQAAYREVIADPTYLDQVLAEGALKANEAANWTLNNCRQAMGFVPAVPPKR